MSESRFDSRPGTGSDEIIYPGKSPWKACVKLVLLAVVAAVVTAAFAASEDFRTWLRVERDTAPWAAALSGGAATLLLVVAAWTWHTRLRWVAVSPTGVRWRSGARARHRRWDQYVAVHRGSIEISVYGEDLRTGRYADVEFKTGRPLRISTESVHGYEDLIAEIQTGAAAAVKIFVPTGASKSGGSRPGLSEFGPLQIDADGVGWGKDHYRWDEIESYEVAVGYLRIQPANGTEFLRRLCELGDWKPAVAKLDKNVGSRRVGPATAGRA